jgi:hypothetical protein
MLMELAELQRYVVPVRVLDFGVRELRAAGLTFAFDAALEPAAFEFDFPAPRNNPMTDETN